MKCALASKILFGTVFIKFLRPEKEMRSFLSNFTAYFVPVLRQKCFNFVALYLFYVQSFNFTATIKFQKFQFYGNYKISKNFYSKWPSLCICVDFVALFLEDMLDFMSNCPILLLLNDFNGDIMNWPIIVPT